MQEDALQCCWMKASLVLLVALLVVPRRWVVRGRWRPFVF